MATIYERFGSNVRTIRKKKNIRQEKLAEQISRQPRTIIDIEAGRRNPTLKTIYKIAKALQVDVADLFR